MLIELDRKKMTEIARRNDIARKLGLGVTITKGVEKLSDLEGLLRAVRAYDNFTEKNDPYEAHDMGDFVWKDQKIIWKIDYYNPQLTCFEDPMSPDCKRLITVMLSEEY